MARRAAGALVVMLAFGAAVLPVIVGVAGTAPADAATGASNQPPATVAFTGLSPQWASPGATITVTGSVTDTAPVAERLVVQLLDSGTPVSSITELQQGASGGIYGLAGSVLPRASWESGLLKPGEKAGWSIQVPASSMGLTSFGVYPLAAQVEDVAGIPLNDTVTYVPYVPAAKGPYGSSIPAAQKISWVWPLIDQPLLDEPWQSACTGPQAAALAKSLTSSGRLGRLVDAAGAAAGTTVIQAQAAQAGSGHSTVRQSALTEQDQSLASYDALTWAVDPALLANVAALSQCGARQPQWAEEASAWLSRLKNATVGQPLFATPYGDPDVAALISAGYAADVNHAFTYGRLGAGQILGRDLTPAAAPAGTGQTDQATTAGLAWAAGGPTSYATLENLAAVDGVSTVLLSSSAFGAAQTSVLRTLDGAGSYMNVLLANDSLTSLLGSAARGPGSVFTIGQEFLAETALLAQQSPSAPIIVAPPQRWQPSASLAASLLTDTATAPWLSPATLASLASAKNLPSVSAPAISGGPGLGPGVQDPLSTLDRVVSQVLALRANADPALYLAVSTVESSAYAGRFKDTALAMMAALTSQMAGQEQEVHIIAESRITLGGTRGSVPVSIDNRLGYPVQVALQLSYDTASGTKITTSPPGVVTVPARTAQTIKLRVTATQTGSMTVTMTLVNKAGQPLAGRPVRTTLQTTQVGLLGMIIFAAALGVFLVASAARAVRRGRPRGSPDDPDNPGSREDDQPGHSSGEAAPDTVVTEHGELGAAGTPRRR